MGLFKKKRKEKKISETSKVRHRLAQFCVGDGLDIGYGGDPIVQHAICIDLPKPYAKYLNHPQHLHGDAMNLHWFKDHCMDFVYSSHLLEDFRDTAAVLDEWFRVLRAGGLLILYLPDERTYRSYCEKLGKPPNMHHVHSDFSLDFVKRIIKSRGDIEIIHEKFPSEIYNFELVLKKKS